MPDTTDYVLPDPALRWIGKDDAMNRLIVEITDRRNRRRQQVKASRLGYFWIPCPHCGRMFGGHERVVDHEGRYAHSTIADGFDDVGPTSGRVICPLCVVAGVGLRDLYWVDRFVDLSRRVAALERQAPQ